MFHRETMTEVVASEKLENDGTGTDPAGNSLERQVVRFYDHKTQEILRRYGPGPRVHYHTGLVDDAPAPYASSKKLRDEVIAAQERTLHYAAKLWDANTQLSSNVLDVGCGLGGGAIFWAQEFGAHVTAVTIAPSHIELVRKFTAQAGVASQVRAILCEASAVPGENCFDSAVAIDSSSSFSRRPWFRRLARLLRPGGCVFISDCCLGRSKYAEPFNRHWCCQIGTIEEYAAAAREAGFVVEMIEDVSLRVVHFWTRTLALMRIEAQENRLPLSQRTKLDDSVRTHSLVRQGLLDGGLRQVLMSFVRD